MGITLRGLSHVDIPAWAVLLNAAEKVDHTGEHYTEGDLAEELSNPEIELGKDLMGAFHGADLIGYFGVLPRGAADGRFTMHLQGSVLPARRGQGVGTGLVDAMIDRAKQAHRDRRPDLALKLKIDGSTANESQRELFDAFGLLPRRWSFVMRNALDGVPAAAQPADGYQVRTYEDSMDEPLRAAHNEAFLDHPDFVPWTTALWRQFTTGSRAFRPELTFVVTSVGSSQIAAYLTSSEYDGYFEATGRREAYVGKLGTLPAHRGAGLASTLLAHALVAYRDAGYDEAALDVDSENPTGALGIYRRAGFEVETQSTNYSLVIDP
ncbi:GNAT family N-acetyltransferase [Angustibacter sp. McL0619]|uniref:GNAT family N-acetyltransferase n=1 Tax=Angustibacter sp. McL0619 TaxID=3415676 RepID=UPI003CF1BB38